jgi:hypothetical protein
MLAFILGIFLISFVSADLLDIVNLNSKLKADFTISPSENEYPALSIKGWLGLQDKADLVLKILKLRNIPIFLPYYCIPSSDSVLS